MNQHIQATGLALAMVLAAAGVANADTAPDAKGAAAALSAVKDICLPMLKGEPVATVAKATGLRSNRGGWVLTIQGKRRIEVDPPHGSNPHVCSLTVIHDPAASDSIEAALSQWATAQSPALQPLKTKEKVTGALYQLTTSSWYGKTDKGDLAVVYSEDKTLDGKPVQGNLDQASMTVALTPSAS